MNEYSVNMNVLFSDLKHAEDGIMSLCDAVKFVSERANNISISINKIENNEDVPQDEHSVIRIWFQAKRAIELAGVSDPVFRDRILNELANLQVIPNVEPGHIHP